MIVTDHFILINFPKTGSTFTREVVKELYQNKRRKSRNPFKWLRGNTDRGNQGIRELYLPKSEFKHGYNTGADQHGRYEQVPEEYRNKPVLTVVRDPLERNISFYEYGWWKSKPVIPPDDLRRVLPAYPELDFPAYLEYQKFTIGFRDTGISVPDDVGSQTVQFIQFFFKNPKQAFRRLNDNYIYSGEYKKDMPALNMLKTESLNRDLRAYLMNAGFEGSDVEFIRKKAPVRPDGTERKSGQRRREYLTPGIEQYIRNTERYLYRIYSDHGLLY